MYTNKSDIYFIPIFSAGDISSEVENTQGTEIIDRHLDAAIRGSLFFPSGASDMVISEGTYTPSAISGIYSVTLSSLEAFINGIYVKSDVTKTWSGIASGISYLFASLQEVDYPTSSRSKGSWACATSASPTPTSGRLLLAKLIASGVSGTIYSDPVNATGKIVYSGVIGTDLIADGAITSAKLASGVGGTAITDGSIVGSYIASGTMSMPATILQPMGYKSSDGSSGITRTIVLSGILDNYYYYGTSGVTDITITVENGLITGWTP